MSLKNCNRILVPVDFSADSKRAVTEALSIRKAVKADLTLLYVLPDQAGDMEYVSKKDRNKILGGLLKESKKNMMAFINKNGVAKKAKKQGFQLKTRIIFGEPEAMILKIAKRGKADMIVVGSSGNTGLSKWLLGSTAKRVLQKSNIPVLVARKS